MVWHGDDGQWIKGRYQKRNSKVLVYNIPENLMPVQAPLLNPEVKAAVNENAVKRDNILSEKQKQLACILSCMAEAMSYFLTIEGREKSLSYASRLLCHIHYTNSTTRQIFQLTCLNKEVKDNIKVLKLDQLLFGTDLSETLKSMKAITKTGAEMRPAVNKVKVPPKAQQPEQSSSRSLNWSFPPPPPPPATRRECARLSSTAGGRKQQLPTRRANNRRAYKSSNRNIRRYLLNRRVDHGFSIITGVN